MSAKLTVITPDLKPEEIEVKGKDAYASDWLGRAEFGERLERLVSYGSGTGVVLVNSGWGNGKTTFMRMWMHAMRQKGHVVAEINAWKGDYSEKPLDNIIEQLQEGLANQRVWRRGFRGSWTWIKENGFLGKLWLGSAAVAVTMVDGGASHAVIPELVRALRKGKGIDADDHRKISKLKLKMQKAASKFWEKRKSGTRLVITVDELDRCRPDYAVRFMETVKHVFEVQYVTFVIAANVEELAKAIKGAYGDTFDGPGYLERFFDITLELPSGTRREFIRKTVEQAALKSSLGKEIETGIGDKTPTAEQILVYMLHHSDLSLREIRKTVKHLNIALLLNRERLADCAITVIVLCALRFIAKEAYEELDGGSLGYMNAWHILCNEFGKDEANKDPELTMVRDILYWCGEDAEGELKRGIRLRRAELEKVDTQEPRAEAEDVKRRSERRTLVSYRVAKDAIEMVKNGASGVPSD